MEQLSLHGWWLFLVPEDIAKIHKGYLLRTSSTQFSAELAIDVYHLFHIGVAVYKLDIGVLELHVNIHPSSTAFYYRGFRARFLRIEQILNLIVTNIGDSKSVDMGWCAFM